SSSRSSRTRTRGQGGRNANSPLHANALGAPRAYASRKQDPTGTAWSRLERIGLVESANATEGCRPEVDAGAPNPGRSQEGERSFGMSECPLLPPTGVFGYETRLQPSRSEAGFFVRHRIAAFAAAGVPLQDRSPSIRSREHRKRDARTLTTAG